MAKEHVKVTDLELKILQVIWTEGSAPVGTILENWAERPEPGYTTVLKTLQKMEAKGLVGHHREGKRYHYYAHISKETISQTRLKAIIERIFTGNKVSFAQFFLDSSDLDPEELEEIRKLIEAKAQERRSE